MHGLHPEETAARFADGDMLLPYPYGDQLRVFIMELGAVLLLVMLVVLAAAAAAAAVCFTSIVNCFVTVYSLVGVYPGVIVITRSMVFT